MEESRPLLKGYIHLIALFVYKLFSFNIYEHIPEDFIIPSSTYIFAVILHFVASTTLHLIRWKDSYLQLIRTVDHIFIFTKIVATYYVYLNTIMIDMNLTAKTCLYGGAILGIFSRIFYTDAPKIIIALPYLMVGWSILFDPVCAYTVIEKYPDAFRWAMMGGICYTLGAVAYMLKWPNPLPGILEFHEVFHIFGSLGTFCFNYSIFWHTLPLLS